MIDLSVICEHCEWLLKWWSVVGHLAGVMSWAAQELTFIFIDHPSFVFDLNFSENPTIKSNSASVLLKGWRQEYFNIDHVYGDLFKHVLFAIQNVTKILSKDINSKVWLAKAGL